MLHYIERRLLICLFVSLAGWLVGRSVGWLVGCRLLEVYTDDEGSTASHCVL